MTTVGHRFRSPLEHVVGDDLFEIVRQGAGQVEVDVLAGDLVPASGPGLANGETHTNLGLISLTEATKFQPHSQ